MYICSVNNCSYDAKVPSALDGDIACSDDDDIHGRDENYNGIYDFPLEGHAPNKKSNELMNHNFERYTKKAAVIDNVEFHKKREAPLELACRVCPC